MNSRSTWALMLGLLLLWSAGPLPALGAETQRPAIPAGLDNTAPAIPAGLDNTAPAIPAGLGGASLTQAQSAPGLPPGLGGSGDSSSGPGTTPGLPAGLGGTDSPPPAVPSFTERKAAKEEDAGEDEERSALRFGGFAEVRGGQRLDEDTNLRRATLAEARFQFKSEWLGESLALRLKADLLYDQVEDDRQKDAGHSNELNLEQGRGRLDLREASAAFSPLSFLDIKAGRQTITWGTGDLVFINDLFPKDYRSFFLGRDEEYLKAPSDALKFSAFSPWLNLDLVYSPRFDADRHVDGSRLSYFDPALGRIAASPVVTDQPDRAGEDDEWAARLHGVAGTYEIALYGYRGFWKSPVGFDPATGHATFPRLAVYGSSLRGPLGGGLANVEVGTYRSLDDTIGDNPLVRNGETRALVGYEVEAVTSLTLGLQYYQERMRRYKAYVQSLPPGITPAERDRRLYTLRLTWLTFKQNLVWSWFSFFSPQDKDAYHRVKVRYKASDAWSLETGGNLFSGERDDGFFNQFHENANAYGAVRYSF